MLLRTPYSLKWKNRKILRVLDTQVMFHSIVVETYKRSQHIGNHNTAYFYEVYGAYSQESVLLNQISYTFKYIVFALMRRTYRTKQNILQIFLKTSATGMKIYILTMKTSTL